MKPARSGAQTPPTAAPAPFQPEVAEAARIAFVFGMDEIFLVGALTAFAGAVVSLLLVRGRDLHPGSASP